MWLLIVPSAVVAVVAHFLSCPSFHVSLQGSVHSGYTISRTWRLQRVMTVDTRMFSCLRDVFIRVVLGCLFIPTARRTRYLSKPPIRLISWNDCAMNNETRSF